MMNESQLLQEQLIISKNVKKENFIDFKTIMGFDVAYFDSKAICFGILMDNNLNIIERKYVIEKVDFSYKPGFFAFREGPLILNTFNLFNKFGDVIMVEGHGLSHPRDVGLACYVGVKLDRATIGIAKNLLVGDVDNGKVYYDSNLVGEELYSREHSNPIYVSIGNKITLDKAVKIVKKCTKWPHKLPEPLYLAHKCANKIKKNLNNVDNEYRKTYI